MPETERMQEKMLLKANLMHPHDNKFSKLGFLRFQTSLYDSLGDFLAVLFPSKSQLKAKYGYKNALAVPYYWILYVLDMAGIRKSK